MKDAFTAFDNEKKGAISLDIIGTIFEMLGHSVNEEELDDIIDEFDEDESGEIEFPEFIKLAARFVEPEEDYDVLKKELREVFMLYDKESRGYIPIAEFKTILKELDPELPEDELDEMIDEIDADGSGTIDFDGECNEALLFARGRSASALFESFPKRWTALDNPSLISLFSEFMDVMAGSD